MLNHDMIDTLYASLTKEKQQELITLLFKRSKQTMNYFRRTKDISLSKLETLADFFGMPLDYFRVGSSFKANNVSGNNNSVGNVSVNTNLMIENESLRREMDGLKEANATLKDAMKAKEDAMKAKDDLIEVLRAQIAARN